MDALNAIEFFIKYVLKQGIVTLLVVHKWWIGEVLG